MRKNCKKRINRKRRKTERDAKKALESKLVIILIKETVPLGAIALLGKGLGFVPTPKINIEETRLDMRLVANKILYHSHNKLSDSSPLRMGYKMPAKYRRKVYSKATPSSEQAVNTITDSMASDLDHSLKNIVHKNSESNLTLDEQ